MQTACQGAYTNVQGARPPLGCNLLRPCSRPRSLSSSSFRWASAAACWPTCTGRTCACATGPPSRGPTTRRCAFLDAQAAGLESPEGLPELCAARCRAGHCACLRQPDQADSCCVQSRHAGTGCTHQIVLEPTFAGLGSPQRQGPAAAGHGACPPALPRLCHPLVPSSWPAPGVKRRLLREQSTAAQIVGRCCRARRRNRFACAVDDLGLGFLINTLSVTMDSC